MPRRLSLPLVFAGWAVFTGFLVAGSPPCVDLPAHGAQLQTLVGLFRGEPDVSAIYEVTFPLGYGLPFWLFLPAAFAVNGAFAVRLALWVTLQLWLLSVLALLRAFDRPAWLVALGLPLAFNVSYWYGLLPGLFAQPFVLFALAAFAQALSRPRWLVWVNLAALVAMLSHLVAFVALVVALLGLALSRAGRVRALLFAAGGVVLPLLASLPKVFSMADRAVTAGPWPATEYAAASHVNWFFKNYGPEGSLAALAPLVITVVLVLAFLVRRRVEPSGPALAFLALALLYAATPKTLSGIFLISVRLPVLAAAVSLAVVDPKWLPRPVRLLLVGLSFASLWQTVQFHQRFAEATAGLDELVARRPPSRHGYVSLEGRTVLGSHHVYLDHLGQWWTATWGGVGHNFFADAEHHPVRERPGRERPRDLWSLDPADLAQFDQLLVYGGVALPPPLAGWTELERAGAWRLLASPRTAVPPP